MSSFVCVCFLHLRYYFLPFSLGGEKYEYSNICLKVSWHRIRSFFFMLVLLRKTSFSGHLLCPIFQSSFMLQITNFQMTSEDWLPVYDMWVLMVSVSLLSCLNPIQSISDIQSWMSIMLSGPSIWSPIFLWCLSMEEVELQRDILWESWELGVLVAIRLITSLDLLKRHEVFQGLSNFTGSAILEVPTRWNCQRFKISDMNTLVDS